MPLLICPNCSVGMQEAFRSGVQLDHCPQCRSIWLDRGELEKILNDRRLVDRDEQSPSYYGEKSDLRHRKPFKRKHWLLDILD